MKYCKYSKYTVIMVHKRSHNFVKNGPFLPRFLHRDGGLTTLSKEGAMGGYEKGGHLRARLRHSIIICHFDIVVSLPVFSRIYCLLFSRISRNIIEGIKPYKAI